MARARGRTCSLRRGAPRNEEHRRPRPASGPSPRARAPAPLPQAAPPPTISLHLYLISGADWPRLCRVSAITIRAAIPNTSAVWRPSSAALRLGREGVLRPLPSPLLSALYLHVVLYAPPSCLPVSILQYFYSVVSVVS